MKLNATLYPGSKFGTVFRALLASCCHHFDKLDDVANAFRRSYPNYEVELCGDQVTLRSLRDKRLHAIITSAS